jgi:hypothetical protein
MPAKLFKVKDLISKEDNPRFIDAHKFDALLDSLKEFPDMMRMRPIIIDEDNIILCGNMRFEALKDLGHNEVFAKKVTNLSQAEKDELLIKDNITFGDWDEEILDKLWDTGLLNKWMGKQDVDYSMLDYEDLSLDMDEVTENVKRSIHLKVVDHKEEIVSMVSELRKRDVYIGGIFIHALQNALHG